MKFLLSLAQKMYLAFTCILSKEIIELNRVLQQRMHELMERTPAFMADFPLGMIQANTALHLSLTKK